MNALYATRSFHPPGPLPCCASSGAAPWASCLPGRLWRRVAVNAAAARLAELRNLGALVRRPRPRRPEPQASSPSTPRARRRPPSPWSCCKAPGSRTAAGRADADDGRWTSRRRRRRHRRGMRGVDRTSSRATSCAGGAAREDHGFRHRPQVLKRALKSGTVGSPSMSPEQVGGHRWTIARHLSLGTLRARWWRAGRRSPGNLGMLLDSIVRSPATPLAAPAGLAGVVIARMRRTRRPATRTRRKSRATWRNAGRCGACARASPATARSVRSYDHADQRCHPDFEHAPEGLERRVHSAAGTAAARTSRSTGYAVAAAAAPLAGGPPPG